MGPSGSCTHCGSRAQCAGGARACLIIHTRRKNIQHRIGGTLWEALAARGRRRGGLGPLDPSTWGASARVHTGISGNSLRVPIEIRDV